MKNGEEEEDTRVSRKGSLIFSPGKDTTLTQEVLTWMVDVTFQTSQLM